MKSYSPLSLQNLNAFFRRFRRILACNAGNASLEFAVAFSIFGVPAMVGTSEVALMTYNSIELTNAAHTGAMYGMISSTFAADATGMQNAAKSEASDFGAAMTVTPTTYYACSSAVDGAQYSTQSAASQVCPANASNHYLQFVKVVATSSFTPPMQLPGLPHVWTMSSTSVMEVQE